MKDFFIGKKLHWLLLVGLIAVMWWLGAHQYHRVDYPGFLFILLGLAAAAVVFVILTTRSGDRITREPFEEDDAG
jgi:prepilin signal peptidase PulO-like enzyme (type II secretory pathway)